MGRCIEAGRGESTEEKERVRDITTKAAFTSPTANAQVRGRARDPSSFYRFMQEVGDYFPFHACKVGNQWKTREDTRRTENVPVACTSTVSRCGLRARFRGSLTIRRG